MIAFVCRINEQWAKKNAFYLIVMIPSGQILDTPNIHTITWMHERKKLTQIPFF